MNIKVDININTKMAERIAETINSKILKVGCLTEFGSNKIVYDGATNRYVSVATYARENEFGAVIPIYETLHKGTGYEHKTKTDAINVPERSFLRYPLYTFFTGFLKNKSAQQLVVQCLQPQRTNLFITHLYDTIGRILSDNVKMNITKKYGGLFGTNHFLPNAPKTIQRKGYDHPLIGMRGTINFSKATLYNSIGYKITTRWR